ncbi:MAG: hypothetical protein J6A77_06375 [Lachnospiraceae bacterium]|nr:hypothetical protein [Lachnospiraceae bacterium]
MEERRWTPEAEDKEKRARKIAVTIILIVGGLFLVLFLIAGVIISTIWKTVMGQESESGQPPVLQEMTDVVEEMLEESTSNMDNYLKKRLGTATDTEAMVKNLGTGYDFAEAVTRNSTVCVVKKDGLWGMVSVTGEVLVPLKFERCSYIDNTGWVEFETEGCYYVYDEQGKLHRLYEDKLAFRMRSEDMHLYRTARVYMSGMEITTTIPEILEEDYYGVEYYSRKTFEQLYRVVGSYEEAGIFTLPDETGRAVAIQSDGIRNTMYYITENGCERREIPLSAEVSNRQFYYPEDYTWTDCMLSNGWIKVRVKDTLPDFFVDTHKEYLAFLNVDTLELVPFPAEYQGEVVLYDKGYGNAMAVRLAGGEQEKYALCKGNRKLTDEIYDWVEFSESFIIAGRDDIVDIVNGNGEVMATYHAVSGPFVNGKMLVQDGDELYFIDETLNRCGKVELEGRIDGLFSRGIIVDGLYYMLEEFLQ